MKLAVPNSWHRKFHDLTPTTTVGIVSDTHGLLRPEALDALAGVDHIVHAGDVGDPAIVDRLRAIAPVTVVRGNVDRGPWAAAWPATDVLDTGSGVLIYVLHDLAALDLDPAVAEMQVVVSGHSHQPICERRDGVLFINPGSAGPRRFRLPISLARLEIAGADATARLIELAPA